MGEIFWELENGKHKAMNTVWIVVFAGRGTGRCCIVNVARHRVIIVFGTMTGQRKTL